MGKERIKAKSVKRNRIKVNKRSERAGKVMQGILDSVKKRSN